MSRFITKVTVTGADDSVNVSDLYNISQEYPFVEWGILLSRSRMSKQSHAGQGTRFPSEPWLRELAETYNNNSLNMNFSGHFCGGWMREILMGHWPIAELSKIDLRLQGLFQRFQLNTHAEKLSWNFLEFQKVLNTLDIDEQSIIFSYDGVNHDLLYSAREEEHENISTLYDLSQGAGVLPSTWPLPLPNVYCGYAGGLSPNNVAEQLSKLDTLIEGKHNVWVDAETFLRSHNDEVFDLGKVVNFLDAAKPWVL